MKVFSPKDIIDSGLCIGCGICVAQYSNPLVQMQFDTYGQLKPHGSSQWIKQPSESFTRTCPFSPVAKDEDDLSAALFPTAPQNNISIGRYENNWVGYVMEDDFRIQGSSGGMASWVATELMRKGLIDGVAHVIATAFPQTGKSYFMYRISRNEKEIREGAKSRYYPVELSEILKKIREVPGRYAVVGVPCMIKAVQLLRQEEQIKLRPDMQPSNLRPRYSLPVVKPLALSSLRRGAYRSVVKIIAIYHTILPLLRSKLHLLGERDGVRA